MDPAIEFFDYPRAAIERRKLMRQIRRMRLQTDDAILPSALGSPEPDVVRQLMSLEQELAQVEAQR